MATFDTHAWWYQSFVLFRRGSVAVIDTFLVLHTGAKFVTFSLMHVLYLLIHLHVRPYHENVDNNLETVTLSLLIVVSALLSLSPPPLTASMRVAVALLITVPTVLLLLAIFSRQRLGRFTQALQRFFITRATPAVNSTSAAARERHSFSAQNSFFGQAKHRLAQGFREFDIRRYLRTALVMVLFTYTQICTVALRYLHCVDVGERWSVVYFSPAVSCDSSLYLGGRIGVIVLLVYIVVLPCWILRFGYRSMKRAREQHQLTRLSASKPGESQFDDGELVRDCISTCPTVLYVC